MANKILKTLGLEEKWEELDPKHKKTIALLGLVGIASVFIMMAGDREETVKKKRVEREIGAVLAPSNTRQYSVDSLSTQMRLQTQDIKKLQVAAEENRELIADLRERRGETPDVIRELKVIKTQLNSLQENLRSQGWEIDNIRKTGNTGNTEAVVQSANGVERVIIESDPDAPGGGKPQPQVRHQHYRAEDLSGEQDMKDIFAKRPEVAVAPNGANGELATNKKNEPILTIISETEDERQAALGGNKPPEKEKPAEFSFPPGTTLTATLITGFDAPTGQQARKDPVPLLLRVSQPGILPMDGRIATTGCFILVSGYGEMSTERARLRGESMTCNYEDKFFVGQLRGYIAGEDGKEGMRGRLVSKEGQMVANSIKAGFGSAIAEALDVRSPQVLNSSRDEGVSLQSGWAGSLGYAGVGGGAGQAFDRISEYYLDLADDIFPVVEIEAGRLVNFVVTDVVTLKEDAKKVGK